MTKETIRILLADDHPMILQGTKFYLESKGYHVSDVCSNGATALSLIELNRPEIAILDISMPKMSGIEVAKKIHENNIPCAVVLLTMHNELNIYKKAVEYGVKGYLLKNFSNDELDACLQKVAVGESYISAQLANELIRPKAESELEMLSTMERKIVELISQQNSNKQIGEMLFVSERTVEWHRRNIIEKLNLPKEKNILMKWALQNFNQ
jgi:DNA-binding NarL/FixJ family response regulator